MWDDAHFYLELYYPLLLFRGRSKRKHMEGGGDRGEQLLAAAATSVIAVAAVAIFWRARSRPRKPPPLARALTYSSPRPARFSAENAVAITRPSPSPMQLPPADQATAGESVMHPVEEGPALGDARQPSPNDAPPIPTPLAVAGVDEEAEDDGKEEDNASTSVHSGPSSGSSEPPSTTPSSTSLAAAGLDLHTATLDEMASCPVEKRRFLKARDFDEAAAADQLRGYLLWRAEHVPRDTGGRPEWALFHGHAVDGTPILHVYTAMVDLSIGSPADYANDLMAVVDANLPRDSETFITVLVDTRGSIGWPNPSPNRNMVKLGQVCGRMLGAHFPERVVRIVVYPVPRIFTGVWMVIKPFMHPNTARKVVLLSGSSRPSYSTPDEQSPVPSALNNYVSFPDAFREDKVARHTRMAKS